MAKGRRSRHASWGQSQPSDDVAEEEVSVASLSSNAQRKFCQLPAEGRRIWETLKTCIDSVLSRGVGHFERDFQNELAVIFAGAQVDLKRESGSQWVVTVTSHARSATYYASVRSEILGDTTQGRAILNELKDSAREVKCVLLGNRAEWLHGLVNRTKTPNAFFERVRQQQELVLPAHGPQQQNGGGPLCNVCRLSQRTNLLGGRHSCRVVATFQCCDRWTSQVARYDVGQERVIGQKCKRCQEWGHVVKWYVAKDTVRSDFGYETRAHLSHLCEACDRFGSCTGAFLDPYMTTLAVNYLVDRPVNWEPDKHREVWTTEVNGAVLALLPHVHQGLGAASYPPVATWPPSHVVQRQYEATLLRQAAAARPTVPQLRSFQPPPAPRAPAPQWSMPEARAREDSCSLTLSNVGAACFYVLSYLSEVIPDPRW